MINQSRGTHHATRITIKGFSLVELIFAVIMLTVIVFGVVKLQTSNLALTNTQKNELQAHFLANQGAEIVEAIGTIACTPIDPGITCTQYISLSGGAYSLSSTAEPRIDGLFDRKIEIDPIEVTGGYKVTVVVKFTDSTGEHTVEAKRIIF